MKVTIEDLTLSYGSFTAVRGFSLDVHDGESVVLLGESGCGKTSTMRCVAGLEVPDSGRIHIGDREIFSSHSRTNVAPNHRNVGMVFQSYAVWPHLSVVENVSFPQKMRGKSRAFSNKKAMETLEIVGLAHLADQGASLLSGGQMQRVALARSLAMEPNVMLLDEPLSNLDARLRDDLRVELRRLQQDLGLTSIYVTHDQNEALALADRIAIMEKGRIAQLASPIEIYRSPSSASIAKFLGAANVFPAHKSTTNSTAVELDDFAVEICTVNSVNSFSDKMSVCMRPETLSVQREKPKSMVNCWQGTVGVVVFQGSYLRCAVQLDEGPSVEVLSHDSSDAGLHHGDRVWVDIAPEDCMVLPAESVVEK